MGPGANSTNSTKKGDLGEECDGPGQCKDDDINQAWYRCLHIEYSGTEILAICGDKSICGEE